MKENVPVADNGQGVVLLPIWLMVTRLWVMLIRLLMLVANEVRGFHFSSISHKVAFLELSR